MTEVKYNALLHEKEQVEAEVKRIAQEKEQLLAEKQTVEKQHAQALEEAQRATKAQEAEVAKLHKEQWKSELLEHRLKILEEEKANLNERIGALRQSTGECLNIVASMFDKTKSHDYTAGLLDAFMKRLSGEERKIFEQIQTKIDALAAEKERITTEIETLKNETSAAAIRLRAEKEAAIHRIQEDIDKLVREKVQQQRESEERDKQITGLKRQLEESSFYHQVAKQKLDKKLSPKELVFMAYKWMVEEASRKTGDMTDIMFELNPFDGDTARTKNTFLNMLVSKGVTKQALEGILSSETFALLNNAWAFNQCVAKLRVSIDEQTLITDNDIHTALGGSTLVCRGSIPARGIAASRY